jgi:hypothetical protein
MKRVITFARIYTKYISVLFVGLVLGGSVMFAVGVRAAIPDSDGTIHGCRNVTTTLLRVIDSANQSCDSNETALNWDQNGVKGYAYVTYNSSTETYTLDTNRSKNISGLYTPSSPDHTQVCLTLSSTPHGISVNADPGRQQAIGGFKDQFGWVEASCNSDDSNVAVNMMTAGSFSVTLY